MFEVSSGKNIQLKFSHVRSEENEADTPSRTLSRSDSMLAPEAWIKIQNRFGGARGHSVDLMALDSNTQPDLDGKPLPHFAPCASPHAAGSNFFAQPVGVPAELWRNPYIFPPFNMISAVLRHLLPYQFAFTLVAPAVSPRPVWWPLVRARSQSMALGRRGDASVLLAPSKSGFTPVKCPVDLWVFRVNHS